MVPPAAESIGQNCGKRCWLADSAEGTGHQLQVCRVPKLGRKRNTHNAPWIGGYGKPRFVKAKTKDVRAESLQVARSRPQQQNSRAQLVGRPQRFPAVISQQPNKLVCIGEALRQNERRIIPAGILESTLAGEQRCEVDRFSISGGGLATEFTQKANQRVIERALALESPNGLLYVTNRSRMTIKSDTHGVVRAKPFVTPGNEKIAILLVQVEWDVAQSLGAVHGHEAQLRSPLDGSYDALDRQANSEIVDGGQKETVAAVTDETPHDLFNQLVRLELIPQDPSAERQSRELILGTAAGSIENEPVAGPGKIGHQHVSAQAKEKFGGQLHQLRRATRQ